MALTIKPLPKKNKEEKKTYGAPGEVYWKHKKKKQGSLEGTKKLVRKSCLFCLSVYSYFLSRTYLNPRLAKLIASLRNRK